MFHLISSIFPKTLTGLPYFFFLQLKAVTEKKIKSEQVNV